MRYCPYCGTEINQEISDEDTVKKFCCSNCGSEHFLYRLGEEMDLIEYFLENPIKCLERANKFLEEMEEELENEALSLAKDLSTGMAQGDSLDINRLTFYSTRFDTETAEPLIARSLLVYGKNIGVDVKEILEEAVREYSDRKLTEEELKEFEPIRKVWTLIPEDEEKGYENLVKTGRYGAYFSGSDSIVMEQVSKQLLDQLSDPPKILYPLLSKTTISDNKGFRSTLFHEFTHAWLNREVSNYSHNEIPSTLNEIFAQYISFIFTGDLYDEEESDSYDRPQLIKWGVRLLRDKFERLRREGINTNMIDFTRKTQVKVYRNATDSYKANFKTFLRFCLLEEDQERLRKMKNLGEDLEVTFGGLEHLLFGDAKAAVTDTELENELEELRENIDWDNPEKIEKGILDDILEKAIGENGRYGAIYWVNRHVTEELEKEHKLLQSYINAFEKVERHISDGQFKKTIEEGREQLIEVEKEVENLKSEKYRVKKPK